MEATINQADIRRLYSPINRIIISHRPETWFVYSSIILSSSTSIAWSSAHIFLRKNRRIEQPLLGRSGVTIHQLSSRVHMVPEQKHKKHIKVEFFWDNLWPSLHSILQPVLPRNGSLIKIIIFGTHRDTHGVSKTYLSIIKDKPSRGGFSPIALWLAAWHGI